MSCNWLYPASLCFQYRCIVLGQIVFEDVVKGHRWFEEKEEEEIEKINKTSLWRLLIYFVHTI